MTIESSRRRFLQGATTLSAAVPLAGLTPGQALAKTVQPPGLFGPQPGVAKLNSNENPYGPSPAAVTAIQEASHFGAYYVNHSVRKLMAMIAERNELSPQQVLLSSGSSGALTWASMAYGTRGNVLGPDLFWDTTARAVEKVGVAKVVRAPKTDDLSIDLDALYELIDDDVALVQITNPNNPTGRLLDPVKLREFCIKAAKKTTVLVDEAYNELTDLPEQNSMIPLVQEGHNVLVARTFSKIYGLAGLRVGYMMGSAENVEFISRFGASYFTLNQSGIAAAIASYNDTKFLSYVKSKVVQARQMVAEALADNGLHYLPSQTNFMFFNIGDKSANGLRDQLAQQDILIRGQYRDYANWSRVSMGHIADVERFVKALPQALENTPKIS